MTARYGEKGKIETAVNEESYIEKTRREIERMKRKLEESKKQKQENKIVIKGLEKNERDGRSSEEFVRETLWSSKQYQGDDADREKKKEDGGGGTDRLENKAGCNE